MYITLMRGKYRHTGHVFVTFNKASVAKEVIRRLSKVRLGRSGPNLKP